MFNFTLRIANPFSKDWGGTNDWFYHNLKLTTYKNFEIQIGNWTNLINLFEVECDITPSGRNHAGASFNLTILWFYFMVKVYDSRHWDYDNKMWEVE